MEAKACGGSLRYPAKTITNADYADDIALLANTPNQAETLLQADLFDLYTGPQQVLLPWMNLDLR